MDQAQEKTELQKKQALRKQRMGMAFASYLVPLAMMLLCWYLEIMPLWVVIVLTCVVIVVHGIYLYLFNTGLNLKFRDPSLTAIQMTVAVVLTMAAMFFLEPGQARASFMMIAVIPALFGVLGLDIKRFLRIILIFMGVYCCLMLVLLNSKPHILNPPLEIIQAIAFVLVMTDIALIGGFISQLRAKVRARNQELKEALEKIEELVNIDPLTGVCNRRRLFDVLEEESNRYNRAQAPFSLCILDIDFFKQVNDSCGHIAGDEILRRIADSISDNIRIVDTFGRYGGEEFLLIMPYTPLEGAEIKAERVRRQVAEMDFSDLSPGLKITVSAGISEYRQGEDIDATLLRADNSLYEAKEKGRNRVITEKEMPDLQQDDS